MNRNNRKETTPTPTFGIRINPEYANRHGRRSEVLHAFGGRLLTHDTVFTFEEAAGYVRPSRSSAQADVPGYDLSSFQVPEQDSGNTPPEEAVQVTTPDGTYTISVIRIPSV